MHTKAPIHQSLHKSDVAGRIMRWAIEPSVYDITYTTQKLINVNTLSDFIVEGTNLVAATHPLLNDNGIPSDCSKIHFDGSTVETNHSVGLVISSPKGFKLFYALKYTFSISNNESKNEAI